MKRLPGGRLTALSLVALGMIALSFATPVSFAQQARGNTAKLAGIHGARSGFDAVCRGARPF